jgi:hypothetical protein
MPSKQSPILTYRSDMLPVKVEHFERGVLQNLLVNFIYSPADIEEPQYERDKQARHRNLS